MRIEITEKKILEFIKQRLEFIMREVDWYCMKRCGRSIYPKCLCPENCEVKKFYFLVLKIYKKIMARYVSR